MPAGIEARHQSWLLRRTNSLPSSDVGHAVAFCGSTVAPHVLIKAKQGEVPAHTHGTGTKLFPQFVSDVG